MLGDTEDHLHIRGEYKVTCLLALAISGSSPHTWRIRAGSRMLTKVDRIISTYVENTLLNLVIPIQGVGSSPHTWRIHHRFPTNFFSHRIISTYVENTQSLLMVQRQRPGSSPHTWRILDALGPFMAMSRIISTYVENTAPFSAALALLEDHLHIRGEY